MGDIELRRRFAWILEKLPDDEDDEAMELQEAEEDHAVADNEEEVDENDYDVMLDRLLVSLKNRMN